MQLIHSLMHSLCLPRRHVECAPPSTGASTQCATHSLARRPSAGRRPPSDSVRPPPHHRHIRVLYTAALYSCTLVRPCFKAVAPAQLKWTRLCLFCIRLVWCCRFCFCFCLCLCLWFWLLPLPLPLTLPLPPLLLPLAAPSPLLFISSSPLSFNSCLPMRNLFFSNFF